MDSCSSWSPSLSSEVLTPLDTILPSVESVLQEPIMGFRTKDHGTLGQFSPSCEDEDGFSSGFSNETLAHNESTIKSSFLCVPTSHLGDSPQCSESQIPETHCVTTKPSHTQGETSSVLSLQESANCGTIGLAKRPKVDQSEAPSKAQMSQNQVRKLGEKITALQQLVSPFGKTDTASVLLEAIGYIKFLQEQVHVLSSPYMTSSVSERKGCEAGTDLRSRGLCLVPISCTMNVANSNGADYWISSISGCSR